MELISQVESQVKSNHHRSHCGMQLWNIIPDCISNMQEIVFPFQHQRVKRNTGMKAPVDLMSAITEEEKQIRHAAIQSATKNAMEIPFQVMQTAYGAMEMIKAMAEIGNPNSVFSSIPSIDGRSSGS